MILLFSILPLSVFLLFLLFFKVSLLRSAVIALVLTIFFDIFIWQILPVYILVSLVKGVLVALDIFLIIFGALFFLEILRRHRILEHIFHYLESVSGDFRVQVVLLAWFLENFIEGTAGFGTPTAIVAPILVTIGFSPLNAVVLSLLGNSTSVVFGAAGTPIRVGFQGLATSQVPMFAALLNLVGFIVPVFMLRFITDGRPNGRKEFFDALPFTVFAGLCFVFASLLFVPLGQEFPSILGSVLGLFAVLVAIKLRFLLPPTVVYREHLKLKPEHSLLKVISPYIVLIVLLIIGKFLLSGFGLPISILSLSSHTLYFYNPGIIFLLSALPFGLIWLGTREVSESLVLSFKKAWPPFLVIAFMSALVQLMIFSGQNSAGLPSSLTTIADIFTNPSIPVFATLLGAFGSFITGSATIANIMFGSILATAAATLKMNSQVILALVLVGGSAGNMIALADMLTAQAVVGLENHEIHVLRKVIIPCLVYLLAVGFLGFLFLRWF